MRGIDKKIGLYVIEGEDVTPWLKVGQMERGKRLSDKSLHLVSAYTPQQALERKSEGTRIGYRVRAILSNGSLYEETFDTEALALRKVRELKSISSSIEVRTIINNDMNK